jgi:hypothetical protein
MRCLHRTYGNVCLHAECHSHGLEHAHGTLTGTYVERMRNVWERMQWPHRGADGGKVVLQRAIMMATIRIYIYIYIYILHVHNCIVQLKSTGRVVQNVWKRMIERKNITTTLGNVCSTYAERMGTYKNLTTLREGCTERMRTYDNDLFCSKLL